MPALMHKDAVVSCAHAGRAEPSAVSLKVKVGGMPIVTQPAPYRISGCVQPPPSAGNGPCVTATWLGASLKIKADNIPVILVNSPSLCAPTGTPLQIGGSQQNVQGM